jgi:hypothetical protein
MSKQSRRIDWILRFETGTESFFDLEPQAGKRGKIPISRPDSSRCLHLVKTGHISVELGKSFSKVADIRLVADYSDEEVSPDRAEWAIEQAAAFVGAMRQRAASPAQAPRKQD